MQHLSEGCLKNSVMGLKPDTCMSLELVSAMDKEKMSVETSHFRL